MMSADLAGVMPGEGQGGASGELDLRNLALTLWRYKHLIMAIVVAMTGVSYVLINKITPRYRAESSLVLDIRRANVGIDPVIAEMRPDDSVIRSEVDVLRSRWLTRRVVEKLNLVDDPEFNPTLRPREFSLTERMRVMLGEISRPLAGFGILPVRIREWLASPPPKPDEAAKVAARISPTTMTIESVLGRLSVLNDGRSYTVDLYFESEDAAKAARIANAFAELYLGGQVESKYEAAERGASWLENKIAELRKRVRTTETEVLDYRRNNTLLGWGGTTVLQKRLDQFGNQLVAAQSRRVLAETRLREIRKLAAAPLSEDSAPALTQWPQLEDLLRKIRGFDVLITRLQSIYGESHPRLVEAKAAREREMSQFKAEVARIVASLESDARLAAAQEHAFNVALQKLEAQNIEAHRDELQLRQLQSEANAARSLYDTFFASLDRTSVQLDLVQPDARVLSRAEAPPWPSYPQKRILLALTVIAAFGLSLVLVLVLEFLHKGFRGSAQVEAMLGAPVIGMIPLVRSRGLARQHPSSYALQQPYSAFTESIRLVRSSIDPEADRDRGRVVLVTSAVPDEGKTAVALTMGRLAATSGQRPLLIDCDLRSPSVADVLGATEGPGLAEVLLGEAGINEVLCADEASGLTYIRAGRPSIRAIELLRSERMGKLIRACRPISDMIILDSPPVTIVSDPLALSRIADTTLVVVRWGRTPRSLVSAAMKKLHATTDRTVVVLSQVNLARHASYGFGDFPHGYLKGYLSE
jgi:capsular exopolysaccharide synthesis family protein